MKKYIIYSILLSTTLLGNIIDDYTKSIWKLDNRILSTELGGEANIDKVKRDGIGYVIYYPKYSHVIVDFEAYNRLIEKNSVIDDPPIIISGLNRSSGDGHRTVIALINDITELEKKGIDVSQIEDTFYVDQELGIGWGTNNGTPYEIVIDVPQGATKLVITYSGYYNNPSGGLGFMVIKDENDRDLLYFADSWASSSEGQQLIILGETIFFKEQIDVVNRTDIIPLNGVSQIKVIMKGYTNSYPYTKRYIKELTFE